MRLLVLVYDKINDDDGEKSPLAATITAIENYRSPTTNGECLNPAYWKSRDYRRICTPFVRQSAGIPTHLGGWRTGR